jgi:lipopolysaccharide transport system permease protein
MPSSLQVKPIDLAAPPPHVAPGSRGVRVVIGEPEKETAGGIWTKERRNLIGLMVHRDFIGRYRGSLLGAFWPFINPAGHLILYTFLFSVVLKVKFGNDPSTSNFALYLMSGLLPWSCFSESLSRSTTVILESPNLVKRVVFPVQILPLVLVISSLCSEMVAFSILFVAAVICQHTVHPTILFLPLILLSQVMLTAGLSWILASVGVFVRDFRHIMALALSAWMYTTPIVYPASSLPANLKFLLWANPMAGIVTDYRRILLEGKAPDWQNFLAYTAMAALAYMVGLTFFQRTKKTFADVI